MNTNDEKIQWHPAFDAALQIEFGEEAEYLEFDSEHLLSKKPMQIDVLIKNEKHVKIQKNIGRIFRQYNIIEYKSPEDNLDIDDFYKVYAYACIYKADTEKIDLIPAAELTITFVCYHYPRAMLDKLQRDRGIMEGRTAGKIEGRIEGKLEGKIELIIKKYKKGCTAEETADMLEEPPSQIRQIYDAIGQCAPDYNVEKIYKRLSDQTV